MKVRKNQILNVKKSEKKKVQGFEFYGFSKHV